MKLFLHIGTEKTGSTLLQKWLRINSANLSKQGIYLSDNLGGENNWMLPAFFSKDLHEFFARQGFDNNYRQAEFKPFLDSLSEEVQEAKHTHKTMIITSEFFSSRIKTVEELKSLAVYLESLFDEIQIICYVREQSQLRTSLYSTMLKNGITESIDGFLTDISVGDAYFNYNLMLSKWADIFGFSSIKISIYNNSSFERGDLRYDFLHKVDSALDFSTFDFGLNRSNEAISYLQGFLIRLINAKFSSEPTKRKGLVNLILQIESFKKGQIQSELNHIIYNKFDEVNKFFFIKFFGVNSNLFDDPKLIGDGCLLHREFQPDFIDASLFEAVLFILNLDIHSSHDINRLANLFRDIALRFSSKTIITRDEALSLMEVAKSLRPKGGAINQFLKEHK